MISRAADTTRIFVSLVASSRATTGGSTVSFRFRSCELTIMPGVLPGYRVREAVGLTKSFVSQGEVHDSAQ
jgi:hypothetical protein